MVSRIGSIAFMAKTGDMQAAPGIGPIASLHYRRLGSDQLAKQKRGG